MNLMLNSDVVSHYSDNVDICSGTKVLYVFIVSILTYCEFLFYLSVTVKKLIYLLKMSNLGEPKCKGRLFCEGKVLFLLINFNHALCSV